VLNTPTLDEEDELVCREVDPSDAEADAEVAGRSRRFEPRWTRLS